MTSVAGTTQAGAARTVRIAVVVAVALAVGGAHFWYGNRHNYYDLRIYYDAINWWADGHPLYSFSHLDRIQGPLGFTYPPFAAVLMYPMAWAPLGVVIAVLLLANLAALAVTTAWLVIPLADRHGWPRWFPLGLALPLVTTDRKSTRLNSSHVKISYAVFCLKKKKKSLYIVIIVAVQVDVYT